MNKENEHGKYSANSMTGEDKTGKEKEKCQERSLFSVKYKGQGEVFEGLKIWEEEKYRQLQGTYPVISLSFSGVKAGNYRRNKMKNQKGMQ